MKYEWNKPGKKPPEFRLCTLDVGDEEMPGWWTGQEWDGGRYEGQQVVRWKYRLFED